MTRAGVDPIREPLARLPTLERAEFQAEWLRLYGTEAPARLGRELLMAAVAYRMQEQALGGLRPELRHRLRRIAEAARLGREIPIAAAPRLKPGTRLMREWQGRTPQVLVFGEGFHWRQAQDPAPSR